jgi:hypothetical protein
MPMAALSIDRLIGLDLVGAEGIASEKVPEPLFGDTNGDSGSKKV